MAGLLYKDFIAIKGKKLAAAMLFILLLALISSIFIHAETFYVIVAGALFMYLLILPLTVPLYFTVAVFGADKGKKKKAYLSALPVDRKQYVASKYVFILVTYYVILSFTVILTNVMNPSVTEHLGATWFSVLNSIIPLYICVCLIMSAVEMPFFVLLGVNAGNAVKTAFLASAFLILMWYLLFGDLSILEQFDFAALIKYLQAHPEVNLLIQFVVPFIAAGVYYGSYRISSAFYVRKELQDEE